MRDVRLTQYNGGLDLYIENNSFQWVTDGMQTGQNGAIRIMMVKGERKLDLTDGTDYYGIIFDVQKTRTEKELEFKRRILKTPGVKKIVSFEWKQERNVLNITLIIQTNWGTEDIGFTFYL